MPFVFAVLGVAFLVVAVRGTHKEAFALIESEFTGPGNFLTWALALFVLGALGYVPVIRPVTRALLLLILLVIVLKNGGGLFDRFRQQIASPVAPPDASTPSGDAPLTAPPGLKAQAGNPSSFIGSLFGNDQSSSLNDLNPIFRNGQWIGYERKSNG